MGLVEKLKEIKQLVDIIKSHDRILGNNFAEKVQWLHENIDFLCNLFSIKPTDMVENMTINDELGSVTLSGVRYISGYLKFPKFKPIGYNVCDVDFVPSHVFSPAMMYVDLSQIDYRDGDYIMRFRTMPETVRFGEYFKLNLDMFNSPERYQDQIFRRGLILGRVALEWSSDALPQMDNSLQPKLNIRCKSYFEGDVYLSGLYFSEEPVSGYLGRDCLSAFVYNLNDIKNTGKIYTLNIGTYHINARPSLVREAEQKGWNVT